MFTYENDLRAFCQARDAGQRCEVDEEMFYYFLEVLPPKFMGKRVTLCDGSQQQYACFGFAEGAERITAFWVEGSEKNGTARYYAQWTNQIARCD